MLRVALIGLLMLASALAGCVAEDPSASEADVSADAAQGGGNETAGADNQTAADDNDTEPQNTPPSANVTANTTLGPAPLAVGFSLAGEDADGDNLTWTLDADGDGEADANGSGLPATADFTYAEPGNFTAVLNISDGQDFSEANVTITVEVPEPAGPIICDRPEASSYGVIYTLSEGGTWVFRESNGMPGLQVGNTHPTGPGGGGVGFANPAWAECENGDQMLV